MRYAHTHAGPERHTHSQQGSGQTERMPHDLLSLAQDMLVSLVLEDPQAFSRV